MTRSCSAASQSAASSSSRYRVLNSDGIGDLVEQVEADAVGLEAEMPLHELADVLTAREVAEVPGVVMGDEPATPSVRRDRVDALDVAHGRRQRRDLRAPVGAEQEFEVGLEGRHPGEGRAEERDDLGVVA